MRNLVDFGWLKQLISCLRVYIIGFMDVLSDVLRSSGMQASLLTRNSFYKAWGLVFPCAKSVGFHIVTQGQCWIRSPHLKAPIRLVRGDIAFLARGFDHELASDLEVKAVDVTAFQKVVAAAVRYEGDKAPLTTVVCGVYQFEQPPMHPVFRELPPFIVIPASEIPAHHPLHSALSLLSAELAADDPRGRPGAEVVVNRLVDILFYYIFRHWIQTHEPRSGQSWALALKDENLGLALAAMHREVARDWSVADLARESHLSRAAFALRFKKLTGETPAHYLARLRIERAMGMLKGTGRSLEEIAESVGYSNAFAFSKAFKRIQGLAPREFRR